MKTMRTEEAGEVLIVTFDSEKSQNVINKEFLKELRQAIYNERSGSYPRTEPTVFVSAKKDFLAGADIDEMFAMNMAEAMNFLKEAKDLLKILRHCRPAAAIKGYCLGGGLELALACSKRIALKNAVFGFPEKNLGIIPGFGGTQRLPRLVGFYNAAKMILEGKTISAEEAKKIGLIDEIANDEEELLARALYLAKKDGGLPKKKHFIWLEKLWAVPLLKKEILAKIKPEHYPAPHKALEVMKKTAFFADYDLEEKAFLELLHSPTARHMASTSYLRRTLKKEWPKTTRVKKAAVVGCGTMGSGIAYLLSRAGVKTLVIDANPNQLKRGEKFILSLYAKEVGRKKIGAEEAEQKTQNLSFSADYRLEQNTDFVIEALPEEYETKSDFLKIIESRVSGQTIIATNTSSLSVNKLSENIKHPERFLGMHFFNPAEKMPLVEITPANSTNQDVVKEAGALALKLGKTPVRLKKDWPGFAVNYVLAQRFKMLALFIPWNWNWQGNEILKEKEIEAIDFWVRENGMPMGPFELADLIGLDVMKNLLKNILKENEAITEVALNVLQNLIDRGQLGRKTGKGFYEYRDNRAIRKYKPGPYSVSEQIAKYLEKAVRNAAFELSKNKVLSPAEIDLALELGMGYPSFRSVFSGR